MKEDEGRKERRKMEEGKTEASKEGRKEGRTLDDNWANRMATGFYLVS